LFAFNTLRELYDGKNMDISTFKKVNLIFEKEEERKRKLKEVISPSLLSKMKQNMLEQLKKFPAPRK